VSEEKIILPEASGAADAPGAADNEVKPFRIEGEMEAMDVRGRAVRLGTVADQILSAHDYPERVAHVVGEVLALTALLGSMLKFEGSLTIQAKAAGAITLLVADYHSPGELRAYAQYDAAAVSALGEGATMTEIFGDGFLAMTIDQGADMERYQGIVELEGKDLSDCAENYFQSSEQTPSAVRLAASKNPLTGHWRAGGIMVQHLAQGDDGGDRMPGKDRKEAWQRAKILLGSVRQQELLDPALELNELLYRLYHEDGVRVFRPIHMVRGCRCSREKLGAVIANFSSGDIAEMAEDGKIKMTCEFCNKVFEFEV
jgi:molecular chaperone Hsp33